jgi:transposase
MVFPLERFVCLSDSWPGTAERTPKIMTTPALPMLNPAAAAIDIGSEQLHVSIVGGSPKVFGATTGQLHALGDWLKEDGVRTVAMEATGI